MNIALKILWVVIIAGLGWLAYALSANLLVVSGLLDADKVSTSFGLEMTHKAMIVWLVCVPLSFWAAFMRSALRYILLLAPLYAPSLFALLYTLANRG